MSCSVAALPALPCSCQAGSAAQQRRARAAGAAAAGAADNRPVLGSHADTVTHSFASRAAASTSLLIAQQQAEPVPSSRSSLMLSSQCSHPPPVQTLGPYCAALSTAEVLATLVHQPPPCTYAPMGRRKSGGNGSEAGSAALAGEVECIDAEEDAPAAEEKTRAMLASGGLAAQEPQAEARLPNPQLVRFLVTCLVAVLLCRFLSGQQSGSALTMDLLVGPSAEEEAAQQEASLVEAMLLHGFELAGRTEAGRGSSWGWVFEHSRAGLRQARLDRALADGWPCTDSLEAIQAGSPLLCSTQRWRASKRQQTAQCWMFWMALPPSLGSPPSFQSREQRIAALLPALAAGR